jgi:PAS domain S-box-containing protein
MKTTANSKSRALQLLRETAVAANEAATRELALQACVDAICAYLGWPVGRAYVASEDSDGEFDPIDVWHVDASPELTTFRERTADTRVTPGVSFAGEAAAQAEPVWVAEIQPEPTCPRAECARRSGLRSGLAIPILVRRDVRGVLEFFSNRESAFDDEALKLMAQVGTLIGRALERHRSAALLESAKRQFDQRVTKDQEVLRTLNEELSAQIFERKRVEDARRERDLMLGSAIRITRLGFAVWDDAEMRYLSVSREYARIYGYEAGEFIERFNPSETAFEMVHEKDRETYRRHYERYVGSKQESEFEFRGVTRSGETRYLREILRPALDTSGRLTHSFATLHDLTDLKQTENRLRQTQKMEAVGQLTGGIAHDFNNLLGVILGNLELISQTVPKDEELDELIASARAAAESGASMTRRLLAVSRNQTLRPERLAIDELIRNMLEPLRRTLGGSVEVQLVGDDEPWKVTADRAQLESAILNLAINARDAMPDGGKLSIAATNRDLTDEYEAGRIGVIPDQYVLITIQDTGAGVPAELIESIFEPFFTTRIDGDGGGLGLSMVFGFVRQSGGYIFVESEVGEGTTAKIFLPRSFGSAPFASSQTGIHKWGEARGEAILVVEDDPDLRALTVKMLDSLGYRVEAASTARSALEILESRPEIDLLFTDVVLPQGMSGAELGHEALRRNAKLRVLFMSGYAPDAVLPTDPVGNRAPLLKKPFRRVDMANAIRKALDGRRRHEPSSN